MKKLTIYLARQFAIDALILFGVVCVLLWLVNCLRSFEIVSVKGQSILTLGIQALYALPPLGLSFFYICVGIGVVRALAALQNSHELHIVHISGGLSALWKAAGVVCAIAVCVVLLFAHVIEPRANRQLNILTAAIAADLVSSALKPNRFTQVTPGVVLLIGGRAGGGEIRDFFADDRRDPQTRRTYIAETAKVSSDGQGYILQLRNGVLQYTEGNGRFSEIRFTSYDLNVENISQPAIADDGLAGRDSIALISDAWRTGIWNSATVNRLLDRTAEGLRVLGIVALALAIGAFPSGRRARIRLPLEAIVMLVAFAERGVSAYSPFGSGTGAFLLMAIGVGVLAGRSWPRRPLKGVPA
ncbi:LptF/LptG family permease [Devosia sp. PTR5]|uniref:LptF/LptG family permease n=1 Tax=Devosia oryzisoli TaxID=2774138 RepID=A0A927FUD7_9HYPH|nr:LptF/LptG family permease [Devosia oryzisoli]MBD8065068.1 LptF/LptG family permease [Devosia oryzisoli]